MKISSSSSSSTRTARLCCLVVLLQYTLVACAPVAVPPLPPPRHGAAAAATAAAAARGASMEVLARETRKARDPRNKGEEGTLFEGDLKLRPGEKRAYTIAVKDVAGKEELIKRSIVQVGDVLMLSGSGDGEPAEIMNREMIIWPNGKIPWKFDNSLNLYFRNIYARAMEEWEKDTCVDFIPVEAEHQDYLLLTNDTTLGCSSWVGRIGGPQRVTISQECSEVGHAMHELGHAMGFRHEHSRPDRDNYIEIIWENILDGKDNNFGILSQDLFEQVPDVGYDIESIMHYGRYAFSINDRRKPTIEMRDTLPFCENRLRMGQRLQLSHKDKLRASLLYECSDNITERLRNNPPACNSTQPTPTPSLPTVPASSPGTPSPTTLPPIPSPTPPPATRVQSGNIITLQFSRDAEADTGMKCTSSGCIPVPCQTGFSLTPTVGCSGIEHQFQIFRDNGRPNIKSGQVVVLKSLHKATRWLDCSGEFCTLSECNTNSADQSNASHISSCENHQFKIYATGKSNNKIIRSDFEINLARDSEGFLNCSDRRCKLLPASGQCPSTHRSHMCDAQIFSMQKLLYGG